MTKLQLKKKIQQSLEWSELCRMIEADNLPLRKERGIKKKYLDALLENAIAGKYHVRFHYVVEFDEVLSEIKTTIELYRSGI